MWAAQLTEPHQAFAGWNAGHYAALGAAYGEAMASGGAPAASLDEENELEQQEVDTGVETAHEQPLADYVMNAAQNVSRDTGYPVGMADGCAHLRVGAFTEEWGPTLGQTTRLLQQKTGFPVECIQKGGQSNDAMGGTYFLRLSKAFGQEEGLLRRLKAAGLRADCTQNEVHGSGDPFTADLCYVKVGPKGINSLYVFSLPAPWTQDHFAAMKDHWLYGRNYKWLHRNQARSPIGFIETNDQQEAQDTLYITFLILLYYTV